jgi:NADPH:quinone reductase-like Zn-dependent oxidoreductase
MLTHPIRLNSFRISRSRRGAFAEYVSVRQHLLAVRYDFILDVPGNHSISACRRVLEPDGKYVLIGHEQFRVSGKRIFGLFPRFVGLIVQSLFVKQLRLGQSSLPGQQESVAVVRDLLQARKITPVIDSTYPLSEARAALRHMAEDELRGKVIIVAT